MDHRVVVVVVVGVVGVVGVVSTKYYCVRILWRYRRRDGVHGGPRSRAVGKLQVCVPCHCRRISPDGEGGDAARARRC
jgi:hypothetical protein